jgi:hypothetical protein
MSTLAAIQNAYDALTAEDSRRKISRLRSWQHDEDSGMVERAKRNLLASFHAAEKDGQQIAADVAQFYADPLGFVRYAFPWGQRGMLENYSGPDRWQEEALRELGREVQQRNFDGVHAVPPIRVAVSSGHGIGKSTFVAWIACWILSTRPDSQGTVTANTFPQLETKTWAAIQRWLKSCVTKDWFQIGSDRIYRLGRKESWFLSAQTSREENSESFAGQHAATSTSYYILDEASAIPEIIWEVAEGGLTDGEPMIFSFGNPTRATGKFFKATFGSEKHRWLSRSIDSRESAFTNKGVIDEWIGEYGEDSDFVRVRVRGLPPRAGDLQFIDSERVYEAQQRTPTTLSDEPLVVGLDIARGGGDNNYFCFRRGLDAVTIPAQKIPGEQTRDLTLLVSKASLLLNEGIRGIPIAMLFVDVGGVGAGVYDRLRQLGYKNVAEVNFGSAPPGRVDAEINPANMRAYMWGRMRNWLLRGSIPKNTQLEQDLVGPGYKHDKQERLILESKDDMKKRGLASPDYADALALTFAQPVAHIMRQKPLNRTGMGTSFKWS